MGEVASLVDGSDGQHVGVVMDSVLVSAYGAHWRRYGNAGIRGKEHRRHVEYLYQLECEDYEKGQYYQKGGNTPTLMVYLAILFAPEVPGLWEEVYLLQHGLRYV